MEFKRRTFNEKPISIPTLRGDVRLRTKIETGSVPCLKVRREGWIPRGQEVVARTWIKEKNKPKYFGR